MSIERLNLVKQSGYVLVVTIMKGAVGYSHVRLDIMAMTIFTVAVQKRQGGDEVALPEEVIGVRQLEFLLRG